MTGTGTDIAIGRATLVHVLPGRLRLRVHPAQGDPERAAEIERKLSELEEIVRATANALTGSVIVEYEPELSSEAQVLERLSGVLEVEIERDLHQRPRATAEWPRRSEEFARHVRARFREMNARVSEATGGLDLRVLVPAALFCVGVGAFLGARQRRMPAWHDLVWYAFNTFEMLNRPAEDRKDFTEM